MEGSPAREREEGNRGQEAGKRTPLWDSHLPPVSSELAQHGRRNPALPPGVEPHVPAPVAELLVGPRPLRALYSSDSSRIGPCSSGSLSLRWRVSSLSRLLALPNLARPSAPRSVQRWPRPCRCSRK